MKFEIEKDDYKNGKPRRYRLELSLTGLFGLGTILLLGLVWVFIFGVLVGRGYQPEEAVPELAKIMPEPERKKEANDVIRPEELTFLDKLREDPVQEVPAATSAPSVTKSAPLAESEKKKNNFQEVAAAAQQSAPPVSVLEAAPQPEDAAAGGSDNDKGHRSPASASEPAKAQIKDSPPADTTSERLPESEEDNDQTRYDYVYQIASLKDPEAALRFRDKVRALGLQSEVKVIRGENSYWHRVEVLFQGRPMDTRKMKAVLKSLGVDKPLLKSKKPVS